jgi:AbrB family looped-hinge helix DNA binding protein
MTLKMDKAGRVTLPKVLRDRLGLCEGCKLEMEETAEGIVLRPVRRSMIKKQGLGFTSERSHRGTTF